MDWRFEEMVGEVVRKNLKIQPSVHNISGEDYQLIVELFWGDVPTDFHSFALPNSKTSAQKLLEKL